MNDLATGLRHYTTELATGAPMKIGAAVAVTLAQALAPAWDWLTTPSITMLAVWACLLDWPSGILKAFVRKETIRSDAMVRGGLKTLIYLGLVAVGVVLDRAGIAIVPVWLSTYVLVTEGLSNVENVNAIANHYGVRIPLLDTIAVALRQKEEALSKVPGTAPLNRKDV